MFEFVVVCSLITSISVTTFVLITLCIIWVVSVVLLISFGCNDVRNWPVSAFSLAIFCKVCKYLSVVVHDELENESWFVGLEDDDSFSRLKFFEVCWALSGIFFWKSCSSWWFSTCSCSSWIWIGVGSGRFDKNCPEKNYHFCKMLGIQCKWNHFPDCSGDFLGQMNCPNSFPETNLFSKNQRLLVKSQEKFFRDTSSLRKNFSVTLQVSGKIFPWHLKSQEQSSHGNFQNNLENAVIHSSI